jgi:pilus assembly protein Flp/PilA
LIGTIEPTRIRKELRQMFTTLKKFIKDEEAPTAVEYAIMVAGIAVLIVVVVFALGGKVKSTFNEASKHMP